MKKFFLFFLLTGCLVGPNYKPPENNVPDVWVDPNGSPKDPISNFWDLFQDPILTQLIEAAACYNNNILQAEINIGRARGIRQTSIAKLLPQINADFNVTRTYFSKNGPVFSFQMFDTEDTNTGLPFNLQIPQLQTIYNALIDVSWEIDLFGRVRREIEARSAEVGIAREHFRDVLISTLAEVSRSYILLRASQTRGELIERDIAFLEDHIKIEEERVKKGLSNKLTLERLQAEVLTLESELPPILSDIYENIFALSILTGALPETLLETLLPIKSLPNAPFQADVGLRSDLLRRRPDVRGAERELARATAEIGVAVGEFFPKITLSGDIGFQSLNLSNLFQSGSKTWAIGGDARMPLFRGGSLIGNLRAKEAESVRAAYNYQETVLNALGEAEGALITFSEDKKAQDKLNEAVDSRKSVLDIMGERFSKGLINYIDFIDSERTYIEAEINLLDAERDTLLDLVRLYKALGGGWECFDADC